MLIDEDFNDLPGEPELAFVILVERLQRRLSERLRHDENNNAEYCVFIAALIEITDELGLDYLAGWKVPEVHDHIFQEYQGLLIQLEALILRIRLRSNIRQSQDSIVLEGSEKEKIRFYLEQIKGLIEKADIEIARKETIFQRIMDLELEVHRERTRLKAVGDFCRSAVTVFGDVYKIGPLIRGIAETAEKAEGRGKRSLPKRPEVRQIEQKRAQPKPKKEPKDDFDDDIPF